MNLWMLGPPIRFCAVFISVAISMAAAELAVADMRDGPRAGESRDDSTAKSRPGRPNMRRTTWIDRVLVGADSVDALEKAATKLEAIVAGGGWPPIEEGPPLRKGQADGRLPSLVRRLQLAGDLGSELQAPPAFDGRIEAGVVRFQQRHGLPGTGVVDNRTLAAMNVSAPMRLRQTLTNLERLRALVAENAPGAQVVVNIPAFEMQAVADGKIVMTSRVVVGTPDTPTPTLAVKLTALNFFPYWHVPEGILIHDVLPKFRRDPGYLKKVKIRVYRRWKEVDPKTIDWTKGQIRRHVFRQDPGRSNALGFVRFDMPNRHTVYMHDTPKRLFFRFSHRARSAGCVRVEKARELTKWLLRDKPDWSEAKVDAVIADSQREKVRLAKPVSVQFVYLTAWPGRDGRLNFREDLYGKDGLGLEVADYGNLFGPSRAWNVSDDRQEQ